MKRRSKHNPSGVVEPVHSKSKLWFPGGGAEDGRQGLQKIHLEGDESNTESEKETGNKELVKP